MYNKKKNSRYFIIFFLTLFSFFPLSPQPVVVPNLNTPVFNTNSMNQTFTVADGMRTIGNWDAFVFQNVSILQTQWEAQVQAQITMMVNSITTSDHFASVQEYQSYVYNSLQGQASEQLLTWQSAVEAEILQERSEYLSSLYGANSSAVVSSTASFQSQWDSFVSGNGLNLNLGGALSQAVLNSGQQTLEGLQSQWWNDFHNNLQNGLQTYQQALQGLTDKYQNLISQINATEMQYQAHLAQIQQSQAGVKSQILSSLEGYQNFLNSNGLFWNTITVLYDNNSNSYVQASCPSGHVCVTYQYDPTNSQFYAAGSCPVGHTCANILYDNNTSSYLQNTVCPSTCNGSEMENLTVRTSLNADGRAFQNVINKVANAMQEGYVMPAIFDYTSGTMLSYNNNCLNGSTCVKGLYDATSGSFVASNTCSAGHTCYSAVVDNTVPASATGSYFASSCPVGDTRCVSCASGHTCQVQEMEAGFLYASSLLSNFLHNELLSTQNALQNAVAVQNGGTYNFQYGQSQGAYNNDGIWSYGDPIFSHTPFNHFSATSGGPASVSIAEILNTAFTEGEGGLAKKIMAYIRQEITQSDLANWIMDAYESGLTGSGSPLSGLLGALGPGRTITGFSQIDLRAFQNEDGFTPFFNATPYCGSPLGCASGDIFNWTPGIYLANRTYSEMRAQGLAGVNGSWGQNFYDYFAREWMIWDGIPFLGDIQHTQNYAWIELNFQVTNNNAYANVTTYQDLVLQLQAFEYDWQTNVMPSITNWTAQVASYQAQYANWQTQMQTALTDAQNAYNSGVADLQGQQSSWLAQMGQLQQQATSAFNAAGNALQNGQGQSNYIQLTQQVLAGLNKGQMKSNLDGDLTVNDGSFRDAFGNILNGLNRNADRGIPNFGLLDTIGSGMNRITTGISNLSLLSSTNNATMDTILGYMKGVAESMRNEKQFTQNGYGDLVEASGIKTREVKSKDKYSGETITTTYVLKDDGSIDTFTDEDGNVKQKTLGDWVQGHCGKDLGNAECSRFVENKYSSVDVGADGKITAHRRVYNGTSSYCGSDMTNSDSYCYNTDDAVVTISAPSKDSFLLGRGASRLGDMFNEREKGFSDLVNATFQNVNGYLSSNKHTAALFTEVNITQNVHDKNASLASQDVNNKVKIASIVKDYVEAVLLGGMSTGAWVSKQANQAVQDVVATALTKAFDLPPDVASFLSGGLMAHIEMSKAKHDMGSHNLGIGKGIHSAIHHSGFGGMEKTLLRVAPLATEILAPIVGYGAIAFSLSTLDKYENNLSAIEKWKDFKNSMYGFGVQKIAIANGASPEYAAALGQVAIGYMEMRQAKEELGMRSGAFSLQSLGGEFKRVVAGISGNIGEVVGAGIKSSAHITGDLGLTSEKYEKHINQETRSILNELKLRDLKEDIKNWDTTQQVLASASVKEYGRVTHMDPAQIELWSKQASDFVVRKQAERDLHRRDGMLTNGLPLTLGYSSLFILDNKLFNGGITSLISKGFKGILTSVADLGNMLGESVVPSDLRSSIYDQSKEWHNKITLEDVKGRTGQGIINKAYVETEMRNVLFDKIGEALTGDPAMGHNLGLLLKYQIDKQEARKAAREQRLKDAEVLVQLAAAAAVTYFGGPAGIQMLNSVIGTGATAINTTLATVGLSLNNAQVAMLAASTAATMAIENRINGANGSAAALVNGLISTATLGVKTPLTGYVTYTKHQNANLLTGQHEVKGGWGGGVSLNVSGVKGLPGGEILKTALEGMKMSNLTLGLSYNADQGLGMNVNTNFTNNVGLGLDYNFKSGSYTANASYDVNKAGGKSWANGSVNVSASREGHSSLALSYNHDGNTAIPQRLRGGGATLDLGNDGVLGFSIQGLKGATIGTVSYNTNSHGWEQATLNQNFQNEYLQGVTAENSSYNHEKSQMEILRTELSIATQMEKPLFTQADVDKYLPKNKDGSIDVENAQPEKLLEKWNAHKEAMSQTPEGLQKWKDDVTRAGERSGIEIRFNDGKSATSTFGKFVTGMFGDIAQSFGIANDGSKMVDKQGVFHLDTCFVAGTSVRMDSGFKAIEDVKVGDIVQSWNEKSGEFENKRVTELFVHEVPQLFYMELDGEEVLQTTWNHPFRRRNKEALTQNAPQLVMASVSESIFAKDQVSETVQTSEWVKVEDLRLRDQVLKSDGSWARVTGIFHYNTEPTKVYNIEVEDNHTYVVGEAGYVVHNYNNAQEAMFGGFKRLSNDVFDVAKKFAGLEGGTGNEVYQKAVQLQQEVKSTNALRDSLKAESNALNLEKSKAEGGLELNKRRNNEFLTAIRNPESDNIPGIADLRKQLKGVDPAKGFTKDQMKTVSSWVNTNGMRMIGIQTGAGMSGGSPIKAYISGTAAHITGVEEHTKLTNTIKDSNQKLAEHKIKEDNIGRQMIERSEKVKSDIVKLIQEKHHNDPRYAEVLVEHGFVKKDTFNPNEHKVTYEEKLKALGDKIKPETRKQLAEFDRKITDLRVSQNKQEAESYAKWNKDHPNEPYKRTPEMEKRRNDMVTMQKTLEKERAMIINREVAPYPKESELHRLEKLGEGHSLNDKQKTELTNLRNEKKTHETQVAALLDKDNTKLHETLETMDEKSSKPMTISTTQSRFETKTIEKMQSKDNVATKQLNWDGKTYDRQVNKETGEVHFDREYKPGVKEEVSITDSGYVKQKLSWKDLFGNPQESVKVFEANGKFLTELSGEQPTKKLSDPNETRTIIPNEPKGKIVKSDFNEVKDLIANANLSAKDRLEKIHSLDEIEVNGKRYVKETVVTETKTKTKVTKDSEVTFFTLQNAGGQTERISFREVDSGYKDANGKTIKTIEMKQVLAEGTVAEDTKRYDKYLNEKPDQDRAGNYPTFAENPKYYMDRARQVFREKNIQPERDSDGNLMSYNGRPELVRIANNGFMNITLLTQTQRGQSYLGQTNKEGKPVLYSLPGNRDGDVKDSSACQSHGPAMVMAASGFKMTQEQINQYGKLNVMTTRLMAEAGQLLPGKPKPSQMGIEQQAAMVYRTMGFDIPKDGSLIAKGSEGTPEEPKEKDYIGNPEEYAEAKAQYDADLLSFKKQFQKEHLIPWIKEKLAKGEVVVVGGKFAGLDHVITITGVDDNGFVTEDSFGDASTGYASHDGKSNHYKFSDFVLGYGFTLKPNGQKPLTETERKVYWKDVTSYPGLKKQQATLSASIESLEKIVKNTTDEKKREESNRKLEEQKKSLETTKEEVERIRKQWSNIWKPAN
ncbi:TIGR04388 family protein [Leptospira sanjuanensis]|uniref:TIGR04388 family protein n=1 Tax=Leptospira sanjuanensis TaxID=2879643 RepID=UPI001EE8D3AD|nr:TIGR04388 family protein [Leptospira sanjuanensis]MCG6167182.1 TIGR04388 family protein [Leptospira sanjuanensis]